MTHDDQLIHNAFDGGALMRKTMTLAWALVLSICAAPLDAQVISTVAGTTWVFPASTLPAVGAPLGFVGGVTFDAQGNVYVADPDNNIVVRTSPNGLLTVVAGNGSRGFSGDGGPAASASLYQPRGVAVDSAGNLYIADAANNRIRKVSGGTITTVAGNGSAGFSGDGGPATGASLNAPYGVAVDSAGNIYVADAANQRIRKASGGTITTVAGNGGVGFSGDGGPAKSASFFDPLGVAVDSAGNIYIADTYNNRIRKVSGGTITTVVGNGSQSYSGDGGPATSASLYSPWGVTVNATGDLYIADFANSRIRRVSDGTITTVAGNGSGIFSGDGRPAENASLAFPDGVAVDSAGNLYIAEGNRIRKVSGGTITTITGNGPYRFSGDGGTAIGAALNSPTGTVVDSAGNLYIADLLNNRVRKVSGGAITTFAGTGLCCVSGDGGPAASAAVYDPWALAVDSADDLYIAEPYDIRKVSGGIITTIAGMGGNAFSGDGGPATSAYLSAYGVAVDSAGNLYIADKLNNRIRKVSKGIISTFAGNGSPGFSGDGGPATAASLNGPSGVAVDSAGNLFIADLLNNRIRKISGGTITTVAGNGNPGFSGDGGPATNASIYGPKGSTYDPVGLAVDSAGSLYIADYWNQRIRKVSGGTITSVAGNGNEGFSGDGGLATKATLYTPEGVAVDSAGNLYIADTDNNRIREVLSGVVSYQATPASLSFSATGGGLAPATQTINLSSSIAALSFTATTATAWLTVSPSSASMPTVLSVSIDATNLAAGSYQGTVTITAPNAVPSTTTVGITLTVTPSAPAALGIDTQSVSFAAIQGSNSVTQQLRVLNTGAESLSFTVTPTTTSGGSWLTISPNSGTASPSLPASLSVTATPGSLAPGTYSGSVAITGAGSNINVPVTLSVSAPTAKILLSQNGFSFNAVAQGGVPLPGTFGILNIGQGSMSWTATATTLSGGTWLKISPASGAVQRPYLDVSLVNVLIDPSTLQAGTFYGRIQVSALAGNTPQMVTVILTVLPAGSNLGPQVSPAGLIFTGVAGVTPGSQTVQVGNPSGTSISYLSGIIGAGFSFLPTNANVSPSQPTRLQVYPDFSKLTPESIQQGTITLQFSDRSPSQTINVLIVVAPSGASPSSLAADDQGGDAIEPFAGTSCGTQPLQMQFRSMQPNFTAVVGQPTTLEMQVSDGCGNLVGTGASVAASFSNGDTAVSLASIGGGIWQGTWRPLNAAASVVMHVAAYEQVGNVGLVGAATLSGVVKGPAPVGATPTVTARGVVQAASSQGGVPIAPGGLITIYGTNLADGNLQSGGFPLPQHLSGTQVLLGDQPLSILYTSAGQLNVQVPYAAPVNMQYQLTVQHGNALSVPEQLVVAEAQPGIFTINQQGTGQGSIVKSDGVTLAQAGTPASIGETVVIYCAGLGAVSPAVAAGTPAPTVPTLSTTVNEVTLTIGGQAAQVSFSGLTPGYAGLYQVNAVVPSAITVGDAVPVVISVAGQTSPTVTMAVR